jgi:hypothetical protein
MASSTTHGPLLDGADAEDRHLRLIDDRHPELRAEDTGIRNREGPALHFFRLQLFRPRARGDIGDRTAQAEQALVVGVLDDRNDQPQSSATAIPRLMSFL